MILSFAVAVAAAGAVAGAGPPFPVLCYVESLQGGATVDALDLDACTHVIEAFALPDASGALSTSNGIPRRALVAAAHARGARALVSVGGATVPGATFSAIAAHPDSLARFLAALERLVLDGNYDGVDLDWEFPARSERALHLALVRAVRAHLDDAFRRARPHARPLVTVGVSPASRLLSYDFAGLADAADFVIHFGYDFRNPALGPWAHTTKLWPDEADHPIEASVRGAASAMLALGLPRARLVIALPLYSSDGRPWFAVRERALAATKAPLHPLYLERLVDGAWVTDPGALAAKARTAIAGSDVAGGPAAGIALWQLGHQGRHPDLTRALRSVTRP